MNLNKAQHRVRNTRGSSFLTRGSDNYDHKGLKKARRALDTALIAEQLEEAPVTEAPAKAVSETFRVVVTTQVYENYGTHCCECESDDSCTCKPYWKAKGGNEYVRDIGTISEVLVLGAKGVQAIADEMSKAVSENNRHWHEYAISWCLLSSTEETYEERELREMVEEGYFDESHRERRLAGRVR